jgi:hypothetical protein
LAAVRLAAVRLAAVRLAAVLAPVKKLLPREEAS